MTGERCAIRLMIAQAALFAAETGVIHCIGARMSVMQIALLRGTAGVVLALTMGRTIGLGELVRTRQLPLQLLRGVVSLLYLWVMIYSFAHLPYTDATAISYTQVAYIAFFSAMILGEAVSPARWVAAAIGIGGAVLIAKPAFAGWSAAYLLALVGTSLNAISFVLNRYLQRADSQATTMLYTNVITALGNLPALFLASLPAADTVLWLPAVLLLGPVGMYAGIVAVRHAEAAVLGPYTLLRLVVAAIAGALVFGETPDVPSAVGALLILASCVLASATDLPGWLAPLRRARRQCGGLTRAGCRTWRTMTASIL